MRQTGFRPKLKDQKVNFIPKRNLFSSRFFVRRPKCPKFRRLTPSKFLQWSQNLPSSIGTPAPWGYSHHFNISRPKSFWRTSTFTLLIPTAMIQYPSLLYLLHVYPGSTWYFYVIKKKKTKMKLELFKSFRI